MKTRLLLCMLWAAASVSAHAVNVSYSLSGSQLCVGAFGCGANSQTVAGTVRITFSTTSATVNANPTTNGAFGQLTVSCVGGGTACGSTSLNGLNLYINVNQTAPTSGSALMGPGVFTGNISGTASSALVNWSSAGTVNIGAVSYSLTPNAFGLNTPNSLGGITSLRADIAIATAPSLTYSPPTTRAVVLQPSGPTAATGAVTIASAGAAGLGTTTVDACTLTPASGIFGTLSTAPANGVFSTSATGGSINLSCQRSPSITTALLTCNETASPGTGPTVRSWQVVCPNIGVQGLDVDGNGRYEATTDGLLVLRYLLGLRGDALITGALAADAQRTTIAAIEQYLGAVTR